VNVLTPEELEKLLKDRGSKAAGPGVRRPAFLRETLELGLTSEEDMLGYSNPSKENLK
jgi:hypothetical protein